MNQRTRIPSVWLLGLASGLSPFGVTMIVPILASIATHFKTDFGSVQFVLSAYLLGLALAQPFNGFLCDRFGRRPVMLAGFATFVLASTGAALVDNLTGLIILRFIQAVGVSVGTVVSRAVVRDTRGPGETITAMSYIAAIMGFAPIAAPILGGWLGALGGHRLVFVASAAMGLFLLVLMARTLPETLDRSRTSVRLGDILHNYGILLKSGMFLGYSMVFGFVQGSFFAFMAVGAAVFERDLGLDARQFGTAWGLITISYVLGAIGGARATRVFGSSRVMGTSAVITFISGWLLPLWVTGFGLSLAGLLVPMGLLMAAAGGFIPGAMAGVVNAHPAMAGTASGLSSALGMVTGGAFIVLAGILYQGIFNPVSWLIAISATLTVLSWLLIRRLEHDPEQD